MKILCVLSLLLITVDGSLLGDLEGNHHDHHEHHNDHNHDHHHEHHHQEFPLATGKEARRASVRVHEFYNALVNEEIQLPDDVPAYSNIPTDILFTCEDKVPGYYANVNYGCQIYHMCRDGLKHDVVSFLCPNTTIFHQAIFNCDWWFNVDCSAAPANYHLNEHIFKDSEVQENITEVTFVGQTQVNTILDRSPSLNSAISLPINPQEFVIPIPEAINNQKALTTLGSDYVPPSNEYLPPDTGYLPPNNEYLPPKTDYLPPKTDYLPPKTDYLPPKTDYVPPKTDYVPPKTDYVPSNQEYFLPQ